MKKRTEEHVFIFSDASKIGACCPDKSKASGPEGLAGDLPATAPRNEDSEVIAKITRSENRGNIQCTTMLN